MKRDVIVNGTPAQVVIDDDALTYRHVDQQYAEVIATGVSIVPLTPGSYSVLINGRSFRVHAGASGNDARVNGTSLNVEIVDPRELRAGSGNASRSGRQNVIAPMPGKVVRVLVAVGDEVEQGQGVVVVEAMKMQNEMKSPKAGRVVEVRTKPNDIVAAGDVLLAVE